MAASIGAVDLPTPITDFPGYTMPTQNTEIDTSFAGTDLCDVFTGLSSLSVTSFGGGSACWVLDISECGDLPSTSWKMSDFLTCNSLTLP